MIATVQQMLEAKDDGALDDLWRLMGGSAPLRQSREEKAQTIVDLIHKTCGKGPVYSAERSALDQLAKTVSVDPSRYAQVEPLEEAILAALGEQLEHKLTEMSDEERRRFFEDMVRRMSDEDRIRLIEQALEGYADMTPEAQDEFVGELASELELDEHVLRDAIAGGAGAVVPLLLAKQAGFAAFLWSTKLLYVIAGAAGLKLPFAAYMFKNMALGWLLGPVGMFVTTAMSVGWFAGRAWRRKERFRKLVQLVAYTSTWRERQEPENE